MGMDRYSFDMKHEAHTEAYGEGPGPDHSHQQGIQETVDSSEQVVIQKSRAVGMTESLEGEQWSGATGATNISNVLSTPPTQASVNAAIQKAIGHTDKKKEAQAKRQAEKKRKQDEAYMNGMITRREAYDLVQGVARQQDEKLRMLFITVNTLMSVIKDAGIADDEKINELSKPFVAAMYGPSAEVTNEKA